MIRVTEEGISTEITSEQSNHGSKTQHPIDLCMYAPLGKCKNKRTIKPNGKLHSLCGYHREKQNANQRKRDSKLRRMKMNFHDTRKHEKHQPTNLLLPYAQDKPIAREPFYQRLPPIRHIIRLMRRQEKKGNHEYYHDATPFQTFQAL